MASELTLTVKLSWTKGSTTITLNLENLSSDTAGTNGIHNRQTVGTGEEALLLGDVAAGGYIMVVNRDSTNFVKIRHGTGGTDLVRVDAGEFALFRIDDGATAPFIIADTAAVDVDYALIDA